MNVLCPEGQTIVKKKESVRIRFLFSLEQPATFYIFCTQICKPSKILIKNNLGFIQAIELVSAIWEMHAK